MRRFLILPVCLAAACGTNSNSSDAGDTVDCSAVQADTFVVGLEKMGTAGMIDFKLMSADPAPPARGDNTWVVQINSMSSGTVGAPLTGATLTVTPFMPAHQHGTPIPVQITPMPDAGQYKLSPVNLWMPGVWETTIQVSGSPSDSAMYRFCLPG